MEFDYTILIRTLGLAGDKYQMLLNSIRRQTFKPREVIVVIPYGYPLPAERLGYEKFLYSKKGMISQRVAGINQVKSDFCLFLDDDLSFESKFVEKLIVPLLKNKADIVSPIIVNMLPSKLRVKVVTLLLTSAIPFERKRSFSKILRSGGYSYNPTTKFTGWYTAQTVTGACFLCKTEVMKNIHFEEECWLENTSYSIPEDQVMYYKMIRCGYRILVTADIEFLHLDAGGSNMNRRKQVLQAITCNKTIFWHRFIYMPDKSKISKIISLLCFIYYACGSFFYVCIKSFFTFNGSDFKLVLSGYKQAFCYLNSSDYKKLPLVK